MAKDSTQDSCYLNKEGDDYFLRNFANKNLPELRDNKLSILKQLKATNVKFDKVLEYGCNYADLLNVLVCDEDSTEAVGVETSAQAIKFGEQRFPNKIKFSHGTVANNSINDDKKYEGYFDLVIVDDVFGWISRETLFQSLSNIDNVLKEGGLLFIRDFYPQSNSRNSNHHIEDGSVFNHKIKGSHSQLFIDSGIYQIISQEVYFDKTIMSTNYQSTSKFTSRWADTILKKSHSNFYKNNDQQK
jgi:SAM-dependent methyltransferase